MYVVLSFIMFLVTYSPISLSLKAIPERVTIDYFDEKYLVDYKGNVRRYGRKSNYYLNLSGTTKYVYGNNVSLDVILHEYLNNEYKRSFVEFHFERLCDFLQKDPYIGRAAMIALERVNIIKCPVAPQFINLANLSLPMENFPYVWPFRKAKAVATLSCNNRSIVIGSISLYLRFEQASRKTKSTTLLYVPITLIREDDLKMYGAIEGAN